MAGRIEGAARAWGLRTARAMLTNRPGHGGHRVQGVGYRQLDEAQLAALVQLSFEAGARWGRENPGDPEE